MSITNSVDYILAKNPDRDRFVKKLSKGYESRRGVTRLVNFTMEQRQLGLKISFDASGWKAGTVVLDLNTVIVADPSFFGYIAHVFKLCFDSEYAQAFEDAVNSIGDARASFLINRQLTSYREERTKNLVLKEEKTNTISNLTDEIDAANGEVREAKDRKTRAREAEALHAMTVARYGVWRDLVVINVEIDTNPAALQKFAELAFGLKLAPQRMNEVSTVEQRTALIERYKQISEPEVQQLKSAQTAITVAKTSAKTSRGKLANLKGQYDQVLQEQKALEDRNAFLDQELVSLQALI